ARRGLLIMRTRDTPSARRPRKLTYNIRLIRSTTCYSIQEVAELFRLHPNAVRRWLKVGLRTIDGRRPLYIHGSELAQFLEARQRGRKRRCAPDELYCCRCRAPRRPAGGQVAVEQLNARQILIRAMCELCGSRMNRGGPIRRLLDLPKLFTVTARATHL